GGREVVEEEERRRAGAEDIVDAVGGEVHAACAKAAGAALEHELRADAVGRGGEVAGLVERVEPGEVAEAGRARRLDGRAKAVDDRVRGRERAAGSGVRPGLLGHPPSL